MLAEKGLHGRRVYMQAPCFLASVHLSNDEWEEFKYSLSAMVMSCSSTIVLARCLISCTVGSLYIFSKAKC
jgi:hypothetical protein